MSNNNSGKMDVNYVQEKNYFNKLNSIHVLFKL